MGQYSLNLKRLGRFSLTGETHNQYNIHKLIVLLLKIRKTTMLGLQLASNMLHVSMTLGADVYKLKPSL